MPEKRKYTILVLEDDQSLKKAICDAMAKRGFDTISAATVSDGIKQLETSDAVDVVWLDHYLLGTENGINFVTKAKNHPKFKNLPIFVVSNTASAPNIHAYLALGLSNFYIKSDHDITQIINDIELTLNQKK